MNPAAIDLVPCRTMNCRHLGLPADMIPASKVLPANLNGKKVRRVGYFCPGCVTRRQRLGY